MKQINDEDLERVLKSLGKAQEFLILSSGEFQSTETHDNTEHVIAVRFTEISNAIDEAYKLLTFKTQ